MATCKDCVHYDACRDMYDGSREDFDEITGFAPDCIDMGIFKNKADFAEVKHGEWGYAKTYYDADECNCSLCGQLMTTAKGVRMNYCPKCGAKMDGKGESDG